MTQTIAPTAEFGCPGCASILSLAQPGPTRCPRCGWKGEAYQFSPKEVDVTAAATALPDEATCLHHPTKKATAVCAGTGDYICSLCAIDVNGQTYSAQYIESGGKEKVGGAFAQTLPRPDRRIHVYLLLLFVPYIDVIFLLGAFLWIPHSFVLYARALQMRREDPIFARLMGTTSVVLLPIVLALVGIGWLVGVAALVVFLLSKGRAFR
jgi:hypothetical protein